MLNKKKNGKNLFYTKIMIEKELFPRTYTKNTEKNKKREEVEKELVEKVLRNINLN